MNNYPDDELIYMVRENNEEARDYIYEKYAYIVDIIVNKYKRGAYYLSLDMTELKQEALVGFSDALVCYNQDNEASLKTFITLCVERRVRNYLRNSDTQKSKMLREAYSLDSPYYDEEYTLGEQIPSTESNPEEFMVEKENMEHLRKQIDELLSDTEKEVYKLLINGFSEDDIASILNKTVKQIYNTVSRIRMKLKDITF